VSFNEFILGKREQISWGAETTYGTGVTVTEIFGYDCVLTPSDAQNYQEVLNSGNNVRSLAAHAVGPLSLSFSLEFTPVNWKFLQFCGYGVTDAGGPAYTHTFALANAVASFTCERAMNKDDTDVVRTYDGCVVKSMAIRFSKASGSGTEGFIKVSMDCVAQGYTDGSSVTSLSVVSASPFQWRHAKLTVGGSEVVEVNSGELSIDNGINEDNSRYCNSTLNREIGEPIPEVNRVSGSLSVNTKDNTYISDWAGAITISGTNKLEFIRGSDDKIVFTFTGFKYATADMPTNVEGIDSTDIAWICTSVATVATDDIATY